MRDKQAANMQNQFQRMMLERKMTLNKRSEVINKFCRKATTKRNILKGMAIEEMGKKTESYFRRKL